MIQAKTFTYQFKALCIVSSRNFTEGLWKNVPRAAPDPILGINEAFKQDTHKKKVNLGVATYKDNDGNPIHLKCVKKAEKIIYESSPDHEYLPITGDDRLIKASVNLAYGENLTPIKEDRWTGLQTLGGTGALRLGFAYLKKFLGDKTVFTTKQDWPTHRPIIEDCSLNWKELTYYDHKAKDLNFEGYLKDLDSAPEGSIILFQPCAHNPTGHDPTKEHWHQLLDVVLKRKHFPFFDMAYQGFATGDFDEDAYPVRLFAEKTQMFVAQTYAKNLGLAGERVGCLSVITSDPEEAKNVHSQLNRIARALWSDPPLFGGRITSLILNDPELKKLWFEEVAEIVKRINSMREALVWNLKDVDSKHNWEHIRTQIGIFAYTELTEEQVTRLMKEYHIYMTRFGRILVAGLNTHNVRYVAECLHEVTKDADNI